MQSEAVHCTPAPGGCAATDEDLRRLRWRCRRGLLENDLLIGRLLDRHAARLDAGHRAALQDLLDLPEADLLDLFLGRAGLPGRLDTPPARQLLEWMRAA